MPINWIDKMLHAYNEIHSVMRRSGQLMYPTTWMNPENMMLTERSQFQKTKYGIDSIYMKKANL